MTKNKNTPQEKIPIPTFQEGENGDYQFCFSSDHIKLWAESGVLPPHLVSYQLETSKKTYDDIKRFQKFRDENPDATQEEIMSFLKIPRKLTKEESEKMHEEHLLAVEFNEFLKNNWEILSTICEGTQKQGQLFKEVDFLHEFGISNCIANSIGRLEELLKNMTLSELYEGTFEAKGRVETSKKESINLTYSYPATSQKEAEKILEEYKKTMKTKGLRVWLAHWLMANKLGRTEYSCRMTDIMTLSSDSERTAFFSIKEKKEHWAVTKILQSSKLTRERITKKKGTGDEVIQWIEQPLLDLIGGEKELANNEKYPTTVAVRVLMPRINNKKAFAPHLYKNKTLALSPSDTFLAYKLQTRAGQHGRGTKPISVDWDFIFEAGNLQATAGSNKRMAKAQARKKMDRFKENEIIGNWEEELMGVRVTPAKRKKATSKKKTT